jgi:hypothetical protein
MNGWISSAVTIDGPTMQSNFVTHGRPHIPEETPVDFCKPLVLLNFARTTSAAQTRLLFLVQKTPNDVFAFPKKGQK